MITKVTPDQKFQPDIFFGKKFLLTSQPLKSYKPKASLKWSKKEGTYVRDTPSSSSNNELLDIRVMKIEFFSNYTFATFGNPVKILRGKWNLIGDEKDHIWFQVWRFGFGRDVSGSTFSEGKGLTQDDARSYWGSIHEITHIITSYNNDNNLPSESFISLLEVRGSVLIGYGLEPLP